MLTQVFVFDLQQFRNDRELPEIENIKRTSETSLESRFYVDVVTESRENRKSMVSRTRIKSTAATAT